MVTINGKTYNGNNLSVVNNKVYIDGKLVDQEDAKVINIHVEGNIETLDVDHCDVLEIKGNCGNVTSKNGNIVVKGDVEGDVTNKNGNIICGNVAGDADTKNGNVITN